MTVDIATFARAYELSLARTHRYLCSLGADSATAEEISQAAWVRGWQYRTQLLNPCHLSTWVNSIAHNLYIGHMRKSRREVELEEQGLCSSIQDTIDAEAILKFCTPGEVRILRLFYYEGYTSIEIAERDQISPTAVRIRLMRLRESLRERTAA